MTMKGAFLAAAAFGFLGSLAPQAMAAGDKDGGDQIICDGINACKGQGSCAGADNACKGQNACKGMGWSDAKSAKECTDKGGKVVEAKGKDGKGKM